MQLWHTHLQYNCLHASIGMDQSQNSKSRDHLVFLKHFAFYRAMQRRLISIRLHFHLKVLMMKQTTKVSPTKTFNGIGTLPQEGHALVCVLLPFIIVFIKYRYTPEGAGIVLFRSGLVSNDNALI